MSIIVSAPGKIHLLGEHAVVYGKPALLAAINRRLYIKIKNQKPVPSGAEGSKIKNRRDESIIINTREKDDLVKCAIDIFKKAFSLKNLPPLQISITSQIPTGCGLGSSAALSAATIGGLMKFVKNSWNPGKINELAYEAEKIAHGNPSGADNTVVVFGGLIWYRREFDFLKSIWSLPVSSYKIPQFLIIDTGRPQESTRQMVSHVASLYSKKKNQMDEVFSSQEVQTKRLLISLRNNNNEELKDAIRLGEKNLEKMEVAGDFAKKIIREIEKSGGAAKVCGAGGRKGGSGILLCFHEDPAKIEAIGKKYNLPVSPVKLGEEGIRLEPSNQPIIQSTDLIKYLSKRRQHVR